MLHYTHKLVKNKLISNKNLIMSYLKLLYNE